MARKSPTSTKKKIAEKLSKKIEERLSELGCDPLELAVKVAHGEALTKNHPLMDIILPWFDKCLKALDAEDYDKLDFESFKEMKAITTNRLTDSWVPLDIRSRQINELLGYVYPKKRSVENIGSNGQDANFVVKPLVEHEVKLFNKYFNENY